MTSATRSGAGSPSHDPLAAPGSGRFLSSKRCVLDGGAPAGCINGAAAARSCRGGKVTNSLSFVLGPGKSKRRRA